MIHYEPRVIAVHGASVLQFDAIAMDLHDLGL